ncbi:MAG: isoprenylcysteine carboxylmethyltransferase family protein [bacterium]
MKQWKSYILSCIWGPLLIAQIVLVFIFGFINEAGLSILKYAGYVLWAISAILGWLPILVLKKKGSVAQGKSYVHTTTLVKTGLYSIVRHPQYTAGILFSLALMLVSQSWLITLMGVVIIPLLYVDIILADKHEVEKFGDEYKRYMKEVPRTNFLLGIIRFLRFRKREV